VPPALSLGYIGASLATPASSPADKRGSAKALQRTQAQQCGMCSCMHTGGVHEGPTCTETTHSLAASLLGLHFKAPGSELGNVQQRSMEVHSGRCPVGPGCSHSYQL